jgi:hypothetical protein
VHARFVAAVGADYWLKLRDELETIAKSTIMSEPSPED